LLRTGVFIPMLSFAFGTARLHENESDEKGTTQNIGDQKAVILGYPQRRQRCDGRSGKRSGGLDEREPRQQEAG
jgi:hypothetical protein